MLNKSPGGSVFPYYYKGGELHALKYGGFSDDAEKLFALMDAEEAFIKKRPACRLRVWVDFYETVLTDAVIRRFFGHVGSLNNNLIRLALVGSPNQLKALKKGCKRVGDRLIPLGFFSDPEEAKTWLVSDCRQ